MKSIVWQMKDLKALEKYVLEYLITNLHTNIIGYYYLPIEYIMSDLRLARNNVEGVINSLAEKGIIVYDYSASALAIGNYKNYFVFDENNMQLDIFDTMPISNAFRKSFHWLCGCLSGEIAKQVVGHDKVKKSLLLGTDSTDSDEIYYACFDMFWAVYPRKTGMDKAIDNYMTLVKKDDVDPGDIVTAAMNYEFAYKDLVLAKMLYLEGADKFLDPETRLFAKYIEEKNIPRFCFKQEPDGVMDGCPF